MSESKMSPDDPRLSAFALGELSAAESAAVAAEVARDPALAAEVSAIQALGGDLKSALAAEPLPVTPPLELGEQIEFPSVRRSRKHFPFYWVSGLAAAGFAVLVLVQSPDSPLVDTPQGATLSTADARSSGEPVRRPEADVAAAENAPRRAAPPLTAALMEPAAIPAGNAPRFAKQAAPERPAAEAIEVDAAMADPATSSEAAGNVRVLRPFEVRTMEAESIAGEGYASNQDLGWIQVAEAPRSTFAVAVDSARSADVRRWLRDQQLPPADAVKIGELINTFAYDYAAPQAADAAPLQANLEVAAAPWALEHRLVRVGLRGRAGSGGARAPEVTIQVEFNPREVASYRMIGYDSHRLTDTTFNGGTVDAGKIGAGPTVTALYEIVPVGQSGRNRPAPEEDALRDQAQAATARLPQVPELLTVTVWAQPPGSGRGQQDVFPLVDDGQAFATATTDFKFAAAVAGFGMKLRALPTGEQISYAQVEAWGRSGIGTDPEGDRARFLELVRKAGTLGER